MLSRVVVIVAVTLAAASQTANAQSLPAIGKQYEARDSLDVSGEKSADAKACLQGLAWTNSKFTVTCEEPKNSRYDLLVRFPSPIASGDPVNDRVAMEWYVARDADKQPLKRAVVVVVHESGSSMIIGRLFAQGLQKRGLHALMIQLPHYGERRTGGKRPADGNLTSMIRQAVADVRRARDAVAALPLVDATHIALQGTSLGGIVAATTAGLDRGYNSVFLLLAGGQLHDMIQNGEKDTARVRNQLRRAGVTDEQLKTLLSVIEPTRIAHRVDPSRTWLYSGLHDRVIPIKNATALAKSARLSKSHHIHMNANHYSGIIYLPFVLNHIRDQIAAVREAGPPSKIP
jgi:dienelactone hydrolase